MHASKSNFLKGSFYLALSQILIMGTGYVVHFWIAKNLGPHPYGQYGIILGVLGVANIILVRGVPQALAKYLAANTLTFGSLFRKSFQLQLTLTLAIMAIYFLLAPLLARLLKDSELTLYFQFSTLTLLFYAIYSLFTGALSGFQFFGRQSVVASLYGIAKMGGAIILAQMFGLLGAIGGLALAPLIGAIAGLVYLFKNIRIPGEISTVQASSLFKFGFLFSIIYLTQHFLMNTDLFMVKILIPSDESTGFYNAATTLARIPYLAVSALGLTLLPTTSALGKELDREKLEALIKTTTRLVLLVLVGGLVLGIPELEKAIFLLYSPLYQPAVVPTAILLVALSLLVVFLLAASIASGLGHPHIPMWIALVSILLSGGLCFLLIPQFQLVGAATATLTSTLVSVLAIGVHLRGKIPLPTRSRILRFLVVGTIVYFINVSWQVDWWFLLLKLATLSGLYLALLYVSGELARDDWHLLLKIKR